MPDAANPADPNTTTARAASGLLGQLNAAYGPHAFGIVALVILYHTMFKPQLEASRVDKQALDAVVSKLESMTQQSHTTGMLIQDAARTLEKVVEKMQK